MDRDNRKPILKKLLPTRPKASRSFSQIVPTLSVPLLCKKGGDDLQDIYLIKNLTGLRRSDLQSPGVAPQLWYETGEILSPDLIIQHINSASRQGRASLSFNIVLSLQPCWAATNSPSNSSTVFHFVNRRSYHLQENGYIGRRQKRFLTPNLRHS
jgi:hypothetical protein